MTKAREQHGYDHLVGAQRTIVNPARTGFGFVGVVSKVMYLPHNTGTDVLLRFWDTTRNVNYQALLGDTRDGSWQVSMPLKTAGVTS